MTKQGGLLVVLAACGADQDGPPKVEITEGDLAAVNALVPADLKGKVEFEIGTIREDKERAYKLVRPKGWGTGYKSFILHHPTWDNTSFATNSNCAGTCEKKDWAKVTDNVAFARFHADTTGKVLKDIKGKNQRTLVYEYQRSEQASEDMDPAITIMRAWWTDDGSRYFYCTAHLGAPMKDLASAFEKACSKISRGD